MSHIPDPPETGKDLTPTSEREAEIRERHAPHPGRLICDACDLLALLDAARDERDAALAAIEDALRWFGLADKEQNVHRYRAGVDVLRAALRAGGAS